MEEHQMEEYEGVMEDIMMRRAAVEFRETMTDRG